MPRRREVPDKKFTPDLKYNSELVSRFINCIMVDGKKSTAQAILYDAFDIISQKTGDAPLKVFEKAMGGTAPEGEFCGSPLTLFRDSHLIP